MINMEQGNPIKGIERGISAVSILLTTSESHKGN